MKTQNQRSKFLVVGAGPAGLALAMELRRQQHEVTLLDRNTEPPRQVCGEYLSPEGVALGVALGWGELLDRFAPIRGMNLVSPNGSVAECRFLEGATGRALNRQLFLCEMLDQVRASGVQWRPGTLLDSLLVTVDGVVAQTSQGEVRADYVVGADGRQSRVARGLGLEEGVTRDQTRVAIHAFMRPRGRWGDHGEMHVFGGGAYVGLNPVGLDEINLSLVLPVEELRRHGGPRPCLQHYVLQSPRLRALLEPLGETQEVRQAFPLGREVGEIHHARGCLVGDAAGFIDPLTGEGITNALRSVALLSQALSEHADVSDAFARYAVLKRQQGLAKELLNRGFQRLIRHSAACDAVGFCLQNSTRGRDLFISVVGNVYHPLEALARGLIPVTEVAHGQDHRR